MTKDRIIDLEWLEYSCAAFVGMMRIIESRKRNKLDRPKGIIENKEENDIEAACAEAALAKYRNLYWPMSVNHFKLTSDLQPNFEVRWTDVPKGCLLVRPGDIDDRYYVLVRGSAPRYEIVGYLQGKDAKQEKWRKTPNGGKPVYMVPEEFLMPIPRGKQDHARPALG